MNDINEINAIEKFHMLIKTLEQMVQKDQNEFNN